MARTALEIIKSEVWLLKVWQKSYCEVINMVLMGISYIYDPITIFSQKPEENLQVCEVPVEK